LNGLPYEFSQSDLVMLRLCSFSIEIGWMLEHLVKRGFHLWLHIRGHFQTPKSTQNWHIMVRMIPHSMKFLNDGHLKKFMSMKSNIYPSGYHELIDSIYFTLTDLRIQVTNKKEVHLGIEWWKKSPDEWIHWWNISKSWILFNVTNVKLRILASYFAKRGQHSWILWNLVVHSHGPIWAIKFLDQVEVFLDAIKIVPFVWVICVPLKDW